MHTILLVDDEDAILMLYGDELTEEGYDVITCRDGSELLKMLQEDTPDVVVLDIMLGDGNGLDLLQNIRNTHYDLPVILCSAYPVFKYEMKSIAADYYVVKGSCLDELKSKISMALQARIPRSATEDKGMPFREEPSA